MRYLGNKTRLAKELVPILTQHLKRDDWYVEPFAGAFGMVSNIPWHRRVARDKDPYIVNLMRAVQDGWEPPSSVSEELYKSIKENPEEYPQALVGFVGYGCSFGGKWFNGYARGGGRNHAEESRNNLLKMRPKLQGIHISSGDYSVFRGEGNTYYCDIPYANTTKYKTDFDYTRFWNWARKMSECNYVFISEYSAPEDFECIWEKKHKVGIDTKVHSERIEKLFIYGKN